MKKRTELTVDGHKKYKVIKAVAEEKKRKNRASVELGISIRQVNRLLKAYREKGITAFVHGNNGKKPRHAISKETKEEIINIYHSFRVKPNFTHFKEILQEAYDISYSDTTIRKILYAEGILSPKSQRKTRRAMKSRKNKKRKEGVLASSLPSADSLKEEELKAHPSRPRKKYCGELIQMDASEFQWFGQFKTHLHLAIDDASGNIVGAWFDTQETLNGYYHVLHQILSKYGIPVTFLTDKRTVFEYNSQSKKKLEEDTFTQFGFACHQLGIEIKTSSIPQAKGRVERLNGSVQSRLPVELDCAGIQTIEEANIFLKTWVQKYNRKFGNKTKESVFETSPKPSEINLLLARVANRVFDSGHHIRYRNNQYLPVNGQEDIFFTPKTKALVIEAFNGELYINVSEKTYHARKLLQHELISEEFDLTAPTQERKRKKYIPPQTHPWKERSFKRYLFKIGKTLEEYEQEKKVNLCSS